MRFRVNVFRPSIQSSGITGISARNIYEKRQISDTGRVYVEAIGLDDGKVFTKATGIHAIQREIENLCRLRLMADDDFVCWCSDIVTASFASATAKLEHCQGDFHHEAE